MPKTNRIDGDYGEEVVPFGKHAGKQVGDVPESYMRWCLDQEWFETQYPELMVAFENELRFRARR